MALLQLEVRDRYGKPLPQFCDDFLDQKLPVDHSRLAQSLLQLIRSGSGQATAHSVHFLREGEEIGSWSFDREDLDREDLETVIATAKQLNERRPRPRGNLRLVHASGR